MLYTLNTQNTLTSSVQKYIYHVSLIHIESSTSVITKPIDIMGFDWHNEYDKPVVKFHWVVMKEIIVIF